MKSFLTIVTILLLSSVSKGQEAKQVKNIKGEWVISNDITPTQARENAINQAKVEALRRAGVHEYVTESNVLYTAEKQLQLKEIFESLTTVDVSGEIAGYTVVKEEKRVNELGSLVYEVWLDVTVSIHNDRRDDGFNFEVKGVRESYVSSDKLTFEIRPWKEGFLTAFILSEKESVLLFPNRLERQEKLQGHVTYKFPKSKALDYEVTTDNSVEVNYLFLLYTKHEITFIADQTPENILRFIANINPSEKCLKSFSFVIKE